MKPRIPILAALFVCLPSVAYAQTAAAIEPPSLSLPTVVTMLLSVVLGFVTMGVQQGSILGVVTVPKPWLPGLTISATFLSGLGAYLVGAPTPWTGATAFYAVMAALMNLLGSSVPALAVHAHVVVPKTMRAMRAAAATTLPQAVFVLAMAFASSQAACTPAQVVEEVKIEQVIVSDLEAGKTKEQIVADVAAVVSGKPGVDVAQLVADTVSLLVDLGKLPPNLLPRAEALRSQILSDRPMPLTATQHLR